MIKNMMSILLMLMFIVLQQGCASSKKIEISTKREALSADCQPRFFLPADKTPISYEKLGTLKFGDTGFSVSCGRDQVRESMRIEACKAGANGIFLVTEKNPDLWSTCYRVTAELIYFEQ